jgi:3-oxoacyl-[acyl-carrier-protein] synthase II
MAIERCLLPGTCNLVGRDPEIELDVLADARESRVDAALTTSFGFGGMNAALVIGRG